MTCRTTPTPYDCSATPHPHSLCIPGTVPRRWTVVPWPGMLGVAVLKNVRQDAPEEIHSARILSRFLATLPPLPRLGLLPAACLPTRPLPPFAIACDTGGGGHAATGTPRALPLLPPTCVWAGLFHSRPSWRLHCSFWWAFAPHGSGSARCTVLPVPGLTTLTADRDVLVEGCLHMRRRTDAAARRQVRFTQFSRAHTTNVPFNVYHTFCGRFAPLPVQFSTWLVAEPPSPVTPLPPPRLPPPFHTARQGSPYGRTLFPHLPDAPHPQINAPLRACLLPFYRFSVDLCLFTCPLAFSPTFRRHSS